MDEPRISVACTVIIFSESRDETAKSNFSTRGLTRAISFSVSVSSVSIHLFFFAFFLHFLASIGIWQHMLQCIIIVDVGDLYFF